MSAGYYNSPIGWIQAEGTYECVHSILFCEDRNEASFSDADPSGAVHQCLSQLESYFKGDLKAFTFPFFPYGTPFQQRVWDELTKIPFGETHSYQQLAAALGNNKVIRAAAHANGKNRLAIVVPCHRVIGSDGSLVGYAGGLSRKQWLLDHEAKVSGKFFKLF